FSKMPIKEKDKRQYPRIAMRLPLTYRVRGKPISESTISTDISSGGLSFVTDKFFPVQTMLNLEFNLLSRFISLGGQVRWISPMPHSDKNKIGIQFTEIADTQKDYLSDYINIKKRI
ncbi:MAG: PilZ domain-containing protein, partial [Candidatus Omnitrophica bacterium]|nr:PilZ domain-containing protein [Candidatus Omnitrophota bacterium]